MAARAPHGAAEKGPGKRWGRWRSSPGIHSHGRFGWRRTGEADRREEVELGRRSTVGPSIPAGEGSSKARGGAVEVRNTVGEALAEGNGRTAAEDGRDGESKGSARARAEGRRES